MENTVKAIVLRIDSPGGGVVPSQEIYDEVKRVRAKNNKTVIASMGSVAASGGYYIAAATERIVANPGTLQRCRVSDACVAVDMPQQNGPVA